MKYTPNMHTVSQDKEDLINFVELNFAYTRYSFTRSYDSIINNGLGQDFLTWKWDDNKLVFVLCDGVGGSFFGNLAAKFLGKKLLDWLWKQANLTGENIPGIRNELDELFRDWISEGNCMASDYPLPSDLPKLIWESLEELRQKHGSETVFICGCIERCHSNTWKGLFVWAGNSQIRLLNSLGEMIDFDADWNDANRWSTKFGIKGKFEIMYIPIDLDLRRLIVFSDGLENYAEDLSTYPDRKIKKILLNEIQSSSSDDIAFLDIVLKNWEHKNEEIPAPEIIMAREESNNRFDISWTETPDALYEYQISPYSNFTKAKSKKMNSNEVESINLDMQENFYFRVRAIKDNIHGPWSKVLFIKNKIFDAICTSIRIVEDEVKVGHHRVEWDRIEYAALYKLEVSVSDPLDQSGSKYKVVYLGTDTFWESKAEEKSHINYRLCVYGVGIDDDITVHKSYIPINVISDENDKRIDKQIRKNEYASLGKVEDEKSKIPNSEGFKIHTFESSKLHSDVPQIIKSSFPSSETSIKSYIRAPSLSSIKISEREYTINWTDVGADKYEIEEKIDRKLFYTTQKRLENKCRIGPGKQPGIYYYRVRGISQNISGEWSEELKVTIKRTPIEPPSVLNSSSEGYFSKKQKFLWPKVKNAIRYELWESTRHPSHKGSTKNCIYEGSLTKHSMILKNHKKGIYFYWVVAINRSGNRSEASEAKKLKI